MGIKVKAVFYKIESCLEESNDDSYSQEEMRLRVKFTVKQGSKFEWFKQLDKMLELGLNEVLIPPESHQQQFEPVVDYDLWPEEPEQEVEKKYQMPDPSIRH